VLNQAHSLCLQTRTMLLASPDQQDNSLEQALEQAAGKTVTGAVATAIAAALFERHQAELAMQWIDLALIVQADCIEALAVRATIEGGRNDTLKAIATYRQIIAIAPAQVQAYREISLLYKNQRDWDAALWAADCALVICPIWRICAPTGLTCCSGCNVMTKHCASFKHCQQQYMTALR